MVNAQSDKYAAAMQKTLDMFDSAKTTADFQACPQLLSALAMRRKHNGFLTTMQGCTNYAGMDRHKARQRCNAEK
jgi:hypothetical protein